MKFITVTNLQQQATHIISEIEKNKDDVVVTKNGIPVALISYISGDAFTLAESRRKAIGAPLGHQKTRGKKRVRR